MIRCRCLYTDRLRMPLAETQMATVLSNADPHGAGRVQVRMNWQTDNMRTSWVRVMTPDGGGSKDVKSNRGFVFIPEVGDQVLLGFRHGDPARPYVMGSLFNGTTGGGGGQGNNCKSLTSRRGSSLKLDDSVGSVTLHDKGTVSMNFDGGGNSTINAKCSQVFNAGASVGINVGAKKHQPASSALTMDSDGIIDLSGKSKITIKVGDSTITIDTTSIVLEAQNIHAAGSNLSLSVIGGGTGISMTEAKNLDIIGTPVNINQGDGGKVNIK